MGTEKYANAASTEALLEEALKRLKAVRGPDARGEYVAWCPFHADGKGKPPHQPNLSLSVRGYYCHACGEKGSLRQLAERLGADKMRCSSTDFEAVYDYRDENGEVLFQVVRRASKKFAQRRPDGKGGWVWNLDGVRRVLYRLPDLLTRPDQMVFVVEGEKDADTLHAAGLLATTNSGGAGKWRDAHSGALRKRGVVILPDNDEAGRKHAEDVARNVWPHASSVKIVELPGLPEKGDITDWLHEGHTKEELLLLAEETPEWEPDGETKGLSVPAKRKDGAGDSQAKQLVKLSLASGITLFHDERKEPYASLVSDGRQRILPLDSRDFGRYVSRVAWKDMEIAPAKELLNSVTQVLSSMALFDGPEHRLHCRCAWHDGSIWVDLDGCSAVRVSPDNWEIVEEPPVLFRSFSSQCALPTPIHGGNPTKILDFVNLKNPGAELMLLCYLVAAFVPDNPTPILVLHGVQGSAKTTMLKVLKGILDPSCVDVRGSVRNLDDFALECWRNRVLFFDNLTTLGDWLSDAVCRAVTGEGWSKRTLYTNDDVTFFEYKRVIGLAGINLVARRSDLLDRSLIFELEPIPPTNRRDEKSFWSAYEEARPHMLGGVLDTLSKAMAIEPDLKISNLPRMADFARWGAAAAIALGMTSQAFLDEYQRNVGRQNTAAVEASTVAQAVIGLTEKNPEWQGTPSELLSELALFAAELHIDTKARDWPKNPGWLSRRLKEVQPNLLAAGIAITEDRSATQRRLTIQKVK